MTRGCLAHPVALIENTDVPAPMKNGPSAGSDTAFPEPAPFCARISFSGSRGPESRTDHIPRQQGQPPSVEVFVYFSTGFLHREARGLIFKVSWALRGRY